MPYANKEKQREFQRNWARKKSEASPQQKSYSGGFITWEQLNEVKYVDKLQTWKECLSEGKKAFVSNKINRLLVAACAMRACKIKHGGKIDRPPRSTLREFSKEIGVSDSTLGDWIKIKCFVETLPQDEVKGGIDFTAARATLYNEGNLNGKSPIKAYHEMKNDKSIRASYYIVRYLSNCDAHLNKYGTKSMTKLQKLEAKKFLVEINRHFA